MSTIINVIKVNKNFLNLKRQKNINYTKGENLWKDTYHQILKDKTTIFSIIILFIIIISVIFSPLLSHYEIQDTDWLEISTPPSISNYHFFGTDDLGRDVFARTLYGARISLFIAIFSSIFSILIGIAYGATAGFLGGKIDEIMMRIVDIIYSLPFMFFVILLTTFFGKNIFLIFIAIGSVNWLDMARIVRGQTLSLKRKEFIESAQICGVSTSVIIFKHIVPNILSIIIIYFTLTIPQVILTESFLSFLGLGVQEPATSLGVLIHDGIQNLTISWWRLVFPASILVVTLFCFNFISEKLRDALDQKNKWKL